MDVKSNHFPAAGSLLQLVPNVISFFASIPSSVFSGANPGNDPLRGNLVECTFVAQEPAPTQPDVFDHLRTVYKHYYPDNSSFEGDKDDSAENRVGRAANCGWDMAKVVPYGREILTAGGALGVLLLFFAFKRKKVIINVIQPEDQSVLASSRFSKRHHSNATPVRLPLK